MREFAERLENGERLSLDDGEKFAKVAEEVLIESLKIWNDPKGNESQQRVQRSALSCRR